MFLLANLHHNTYYWSSVIKTGSQSLSHTYPNLFKCTKKSKWTLISAAVKPEYLQHNHAPQSSLCSCRHFHLTPKLVIYHSLHRPLSLFWSLAAGPRWIAQWRLMGRESQTVLSCYSKHSHCEWKVIKPGITKRASFLTAFKWFVIKRLSFDRPRVKFSTVSLLMLLLHFTRLLITTETKTRQNLSLEKKCLTCMQNIYFNHTDTICANE